MASGAGASDASDAVAGPTGAPGGTSGDASGSALVIEELWRCGKELKPILDALSVHSDALFTASVSH